MPILKKSSYTIKDIYALPEGERAELIDGRIYAMAPPNRLHQKLVMELSHVIKSYIEKNNGECEVYPSPFAVFLNKDEKINQVATMLGGNEVTKATYENVKEMLKLSEKKKSEIKAYKNT